MQTLTPQERGILAKAAMRPMRPSAYLGDVFASLYASGLIEFSADSETSFSATERGYRELAQCRK